MKEPARTNDRAAQVSEELKAISDEEAPEKTFIRGEAFNHRKWLRAEDEALEDRQERLEETITISSEFAGLES